MVIVKVWETTNVYRTVFVIELQAWFKLSRYAAYQWFELSGK